MEALVEKKKLLSDFGGDSGTSKPTLGCPSVMDVVFLSDAQFACTGSERNHCKAA